jgi:protein-disulfide isomerase
MLTATLYLGPATPPRQQRSGWTLLLLLATAAAGAAVWFVAVQIWIIRALCPLCMVAHGCAVLIALVVWLRAPLRRGAATGARAATALGPGRALAAAGLGIAAVVALIAGQLLFPSIAKPLVVHVSPDDSDVDVGHGAQRVVSVLGGRVVLKPADYPVLGSVDAPYLLIDVFDYTCPHCRAMHRALDAVRKHYGDKLAVVKVCVPLEADCNRLVHDTDPRHANACAYARLAAAVWQVKPEAFATFDDWLFAPSRPPTVPEARAYAARLVGAERLKQALAGDGPDRAVQRAINLYASAGAGQVPKLIIGRRHTAGPPQGARQLIEVVDAAIKEREDQRKQTTR